MRKRWHVSANFIGLLGGIYALGWLPLYLVLAATTTQCDKGCGLNSQAGGWQPYLIFLVAWFGVVLVPSALVGLGWLIHLLWAYRPRRVLVNVEDIREAYRG